MALGLGLGFHARSKNYVPSMTPEFSPLDIPSLRAWFDAADSATITYSQNAVSQWKDKTIHNHYASQITEAKRPLTEVSSINGLNALSFDGSDDALVLPSGLYDISMGENTVIIVARNMFNGPPPSAKRLFSGQAGGLTNYGILPLPQTGQLSVRCGGTLNVAYALDNVPHIWGLRRDGVAISSFLDGLAAHGTGGGDITLTELLIGHNAAGAANHAWHGDIGEVLIYGRALTEEEMNLLGCYLALKWGCAWADLA